MDRIEISGLRVMTLVGVLAHERESAQPLEFDIYLEGDLRDAGSQRRPRRHCPLRSRRRARRGHRQRVQGRTARAAGPPHRRGCARRSIVSRRSRSSSASCGHRSPKTSSTPRCASGARVPICRFRHARAIAPSSRWAPTSAIASGTCNSPFGELGSAIIAQSQVFETAPGRWARQPGRVPQHGGRRRNLARPVRVAAPLPAHRGPRRCVSASSHWGPRTLDVDLLFFDDVTIASPELTIPHPATRERRFVLTPLAEVAPELCPPGWDDMLPPDEITALGPLADLY